MDESQRRGWVFDLREDLNDWIRSDSVELPESIASTAAIQEGFLGDADIPKYFQE